MISGGGKNFYNLQKRACKQEIKASYMQRLLFSNQLLCSVTLTMGFVEMVERDLHGMDQTERDRLENSAAGQWGNNAGMAIGIFLPGPGGKVKTLDLITKSRAANRGLAIAERFLGKGYTEIAPGVFRSSDKLKQFRMTDRDILHKKPHFNFEVYSPSNLRTPIKNYHMPIK